MARPSRRVFRRLRHSLTATVAVSAFALAALVFFLVPKLRTPSADLFDFGLGSAADPGAAARKALLSEDGVGAHEMRCARDFTPLSTPEARVCFVDVPELPGEPGDGLPTPWVAHLWRGHIGFWSAHVFEPEKRNYRATEIQGPVACPRPFMSVGQTAATLTSAPFCAISVTHYENPLDAPPLRSLFPYVRVVESPGGGRRLRIGYGVRRELRPSVCPPGFERPGSCVNNDRYARGDPETTARPSPVEVARSFPGGPSGDELYVTVATTGFEDSAARWWAHHRKQGLRAMVVAGDGVALESVRAAGVTHAAFRRSQSPPLWCMDDYGTSGWRSVHEIKVGAVLELLEAGFSVVVLDADAFLTFPGGREEARLAWRSDPRWDVDAHDVVLATDSYWVGYARPTAAAVDFYRAVRGAVLDGGWDQSWAGRIARAWRNGGHLRVGTIGHMKAEWLLGYGYATVAEADSSFPVALGDARVAQGGTKPPEGAVQPLMPARAEALAQQRALVSERCGHVCLLRLAAPLRVPWPMSQWHSKVGDPVRLLLATAMATGCLAEMPAVAEMDRSGTRAPVPPVDLGALREWFGGLLVDADEAAALAADAAQEKSPMEVILRNASVSRVLVALRAPAQGKEACRGTGPPKTLTRVSLETGDRPDEALDALHELLDSSQRTRLRLFVTRQPPGKKKLGTMTLPCMHDTTYGEYAGRNFSKPGHMTCCRACNGRGPCHFTHDRMIPECPSETKECVERPYRREMKR